MSEDHTRRKLTHSEALLLLSVIPLTKRYFKMSSVEKKAVDHYYNCDSCCRKIGLSNFFKETREKERTNLTCREAILIWANKPGPLYMSEDSILDILAVEHIWGVSYDNKNSCNQNPCAELRHYWHSVPFSMFSDCPESVINYFPFLLHIFNKENWPLKTLLAIQAKRVSTLVEDIKSGKITVSPGIYRETKELGEEINKHVQSLQELILSNHF